jgi:DNA repair and recombination RAD54-like protein
MGSGCAVCRKTLQGITLLWTLLKNGHEELGGVPMAKRIIICCPTSLVSNWDSECTKWLKAGSLTFCFACHYKEDMSALMHL